jgi:hypothetical protein
LQAPKHRYLVAQWRSSAQRKIDTAAAIQDLINLGAVVVGKAETSKFADVEEPAVDWVDTHYSFYPKRRISLAKYTSGGRA